eukprot:510135-Hanusia_phi.AAC.4
MDPSPFCYWDRANAPDMKGIYNETVRKSQGAGGGKGGVGLGGGRRREEEQMGRKAERREDVWKV